MKRTCCLCPVEVSLYLYRGKLYCLDCLPAHEMEILCQTEVVRERARRVRERSEERRAALRAEREAPRG